MKHKAYGAGFFLEVYPPDRAADVMHYLITGHLLGGRSLDGVTWKEVENEAYRTLQLERAKALAESMREVE